MIICSAETFNHGDDDNSKGPGQHWLSVLSDIGGPNALVKPFVKWNNIVSSRATLLDSVCRDCQMAQTAPRGPVFLTINEEILTKSLPHVNITPQSPITRTQTKSRVNNQVNI